MKTSRQSGPDRRLTLLRAALDLFSTQGYDGTTTKAIAEHTGVTEALLFKHFHSKPELLRAVVAEFGPRRIFQPPPAAAYALPPRDALEQVVTQYLDSFWDNRAFMRMVFTTPRRDQGVYAEYGRSSASRASICMLCCTRRATGGNSGRTWRARPPTSSPPRQAASCNAC